MKKLIYLLVVSSLSIGMNSCKKKGCMDVGAANYDADAKKDDGSCVYSPVITINGDASMTISVGSGYTDLGATAANSDGSSVNVTVDSSMVNDSVVGSFNVVYSASNEHGTTETSRTVNVVINHECWPGNWDGGSAPKASVNKDNSRENRSAMGAASCGEPWEKRKKGSDNMGTAVLSQGKFYLLGGLKISMGAPEQHVGGNLGVERAVDAEWSRGRRWRDGGPCLTSRGS